MHYEIKNKIQIQYIQTFKTTINSKLHAFFTWKLKHTGVKKQNNALHLLDTKINKKMALEQARKQ